MELLVQVLPNEPPRCLAGFVCRLASKSDAGLPQDIAFNVFEIGCKCGNDRWRLLGHRLGGECLISPLAVECTACSRSQTLIDTRVDGYDGEIGDSRSERGTGPSAVWNCSECGAVEGRLIVALGYQYESNETLARPQDWFDAFRLTHVCPNGSPVEAAMFDCA